LDNKKAKLQPDHAMNKLCPKIILEGTRLTFKTEIAFALNEHPRIVGPRKYRYHSPLISAEWCAFTNVPWGRGLINFEPQEEALAMETYRTWVHLFELQRYYSWIVDRFHISTQAYQLRNYGKRYDFKWLEDRLLPLGFHLVFCTRTPESFAAARTERLKVSGKPSQYDDLQIFVAEQELMRELIGQSALPTLILDVSDNDIPAATEKIADWMEQTGGLYAK
jgi:thymidylate kinase